MTDIYQERYLAHQQRKADVLEHGLQDAPWAKNPPDKPPHHWQFLNEIIFKRRSQRIFNQDPILESEITLIKLSAKHAPTSCNRQAIHLYSVSLIGDLLVGGAGWLAKAPLVILLMADMAAYKSPAERDFMPYLDAGHISQNIQLMATAIGLGCCFVNPNIRPENLETFNQRFNPMGYRFCGALAIGHYDVKAPIVPKANVYIKFIPS